jgi:XTP/dITP diphosphohydrolase
MKIVLASHNKKKIAELRTLLCEYIPDIEILSLADAGIEGEIVEDGDTFEQNALIKASAAAASGYIGVGDDSGLCVRALDWAPGIYSARYAGEPCDDHANLELVLEHMQDKTDRAAEFRCCIACVFPDGGEPIVAHGDVKGELLRECAGEGGFGYDPIFYYPPFGKTFGEIPPEQKNTISHRAVALRAFAQALQQRLAENK